MFNKWSLTELVLAYSLNLLRTILTTKLKSSPHVMSINQSMNVCCIVRIIFVSWIYWIGHKLISKVHWQVIYHCDMINLFSYKLLRKISYFKKMKDKSQFKSEDLSQKLTKSLDNSVVILLLMKTFNLAVIKILKKFLFKSNKKQ